MDEALDLANYLPVSFKTPSEQRYISFLWETFAENYSGGKYQFALVAYHMLMMSFIYFIIWQIKRTLPDDFEKSLIGFRPADEKEMLKATSPFSFSIISESTVLRFLKLIACDSSKIGSYAKLVKHRNNAAHANGHVLFSTQDAFDKQVREILRAVNEIQSHSSPIIQRCYQNFLLDGHNPEGREYEPAEDQIREVLIHDNYLSRKDFELCADFNISVLPHENIQAIEDLHNTVREVYKNTLEDRA